MDCTAHLYPRLPIELLDRTVDYLHDDPDTLWSCTSVSHVFLRSARCQLFHTLSIANDPSCAHGGYAPFLCFLERTPEICAYIHQVKFVRYPASDEQPLPVPELCLHILSEILSYLPRLHTLILSKDIHIVCHCQPRALPLPLHHQNDSESDFGSSQLKLKALSVDGVRVATSEHWNTFLSLFSAIHNFSVSDLCILHGPREGRSGSASITETGADVEALTKIGTKLVLKSMAFGFDHDKQVEMFGVLLSGSAAYLENLTLRFPAHPYSSVRPEDWRHLQLSSLEQLKALTFIETPPLPAKGEALDVFSGEANRTVCDAIKALLSLAPPSLERLHFRFRLRAFGTGSAGQLMDNFGWDELEEAARRCERVQRVVFELQGRPEGDAYLQCAIEGRVAVLCARGLLQIDFEK
ncbi:hypothetical protein EUX98_g7398 [Antrodiella citrinella]|uniref:F-box domain-containing protein n=1 Tax=Antrodiella citrinella TaxID=2447956 RepID=A0A4S4MLY2_9APHY|nr:hypothetical protein EUX98_g7398 [Antrodiella citrinella]